MALELFPDHGHERLFVAVLIGLGVEVGDLLFDQLFGKFEHFGLGRALGDRAEIFSGTADFGGVAQRADEHAVIAGADGDDAFAAGQHQAGDGDLAGLAHGFAQHAEGFLGHGAIGREVIGRVLVENIDLILVDEGLDIHGVIGLDAHCFEVGILNDYILLILVLVAAHQIGALDQPEFGINRLHVDAVVRVFVQLVEGDALGARGGREQLHRTAHQTQSQMSLPTCPRGHVRLLRAKLLRQLFGIMREEAELTG